MRKPLVLPVALLTLPFVELALLLKLGALTDWKVPLLAVVVMAGVGIVLIRSIGWLTFRQFQEELEHRRVPGNAILDTLCLLLAGLLFLFPGLLTDFLGLLLLIPPTRFLVKRPVVGWIGAGIRDGHVTVQVTVDETDSTVIDAVEDEDGDASDVRRQLPHHVRALPRLDQLPDSRRSGPPDDESLGRADEP
jgi:UPF0716 protein FxsA